MLKPGRILIDVYFVAVLASFLMDCDQLLGLHRGLAEEFAFLFRNHFLNLLLGEVVAG